jgi:hypothetical protein
MHRTVNNVLRTLVHINPPQNMTQARDIIGDALATVMHAMQTTVATTLGSTSGALAFTQDMFLNVPLIADWQAIARTHEHHVNENLWRVNRKQCQFDYTPGKQVLKKVHNPTRLGVRMEGPSLKNQFLIWQILLYLQIQFIVSNYKKNFFNIDMVSYLK